MVIAKPEWFNRRNKPFYSYGMTWQGWIYFIVTISVLFTGIILPQNMVTGIIITLMFLFLFMDMIIASYRSMDERGKTHYSIAMRNMAWGIIITLIVTSIILDYTNTKNSLSILIMAVILVGTSLNVLTRYKLEKEN
ncbi:MAG TPA: hypothetical protein VHO92_06095 [Methanobacterium sp.]|nr:hypothetical protein [Methanobacterium sp.]